MRGEAFPFLPRGVARAGTYRFAILPGARGLGVFGVPTRPAATAYSVRWSSSGWAEGPFTVFGVPTRPLATAYRVRGSLACWEEGPFTEFGLAG